MQKLFHLIQRRPLLSVLVFSLCLHLCVGLFMGGAVIIKMLEPAKPILEAPPEAVGIEPEKLEYKIKLQKSQKKSSAPMPTPIIADVTSDLSLESIDLNLKKPNSTFKLKGSVGETEGNGNGNGQGDGFGRGGGSELNIQLTDFGYKGFVSGTLEGYLYDTKYNSSKKALVSKELLGMPSAKDFAENSEIVVGMKDYMFSIVKKFTSGSWNPEYLSKRFYRAENKLHASYWVIPLRDARAAPESFGANDAIAPRGIIAHYSGSFVPEESGYFRFVGRADDILVVKLGNRIALDASYENGYSKIDVEKYDQESGYFGMDPSFCGRWIKWEAGVPMDMDVLVGECPGGDFAAYLLYQKRGEDRLRIFSTKPMTDAEKERLRTLHADARGLLD